MSGVPNVYCWYSDSDAEQTDEGIRSFLLLMRDGSTEWAWFNQCDVTLGYNLLAAHVVVVCLFVLHVTMVTRYFFALCALVATVGIVSPWCKSGDNYFCQYFADKYLCSSCAYLGHYERTLVHRLLHLILRGIKRIGFSSLSSLSLYQAQQLSHENRCTSHHNAV